MKDVCVEAISSVGASINVSDVTSIRATAPPLQEQEEPNATGVASEKCQETSAGRDPAATDTLVCEAKDHSCASSPVQAPVCKSEVVEIPSPEAASGTVETPAPMESPVSAPERQPPIEVGQQLVPPDPLSMTTSTSSATGAAATETNSVSNIQVSNLTVVTKKIILVDTQYGLFSSSSLSPFQIFVGKTSREKLNRREKIDMKVLWRKNVTGFLLARLHFS